MSEEAFNNYVAELDNIEKRKQSLQKKIDDDSQTIVDLTDKYRKALASDDDTTAKKYKTKIDNMQANLEMNQDKLKYIEEGAYNDSLKAHAEAVADEALNNIQSTQKAVNDLHREYVETFNKLIQIAGQYNKYFNVDHLDKRRVLELADSFPKWAENRQELNNGDLTGGYKWQYVEPLSRPQLKGIEQQRINRVTDSKAY